MAKRFTDSEKWERPWFRKLPSDYKLLWLYILDRCDNAGLWDVDIELAGFLIGVEISLEKAKSIFAERIEDRGERWLIKHFADFQYGEFRSSSHPFHKKILREIGDTVQDRGSDTVGGAIIPAKKKTAQAQFVESFQSVYQAFTGREYKADRKDFILADRLIKRYGLDAVVEKAYLLGKFCDEQSVWFTHGGYSDFTIGKLSAMWNSILPQAKKKSKEEITREKSREAEAYAKRVLNAK